MCMTLRLAEPDIKPAGWFNVYDGEFNILRISYAVCSRTSPVFWSLSLCPYDLNVSRFYVHLTATIAITCVTAVYADSIII